MYIHATCKRHVEKGLTQTNDSGVCGAKCRLMTVIGEAAECYERKKCVPTCTRWKPSQGTDTTHNSNLHARTLSVITKSSSSNIYATVQFFTLTDSQHWSDYRRGWISSFLAWEKTLQNNWVICVVHAVAHHFIVTTWVTVTITAIRKYSVQLLNVLYFYFFTQWQNECKLSLKCSFQVICVSYFVIEIVQNQWPNRHCKSFADKIHSGPIKSKL